jgi:cytochrome c biogenesis protein ResB
MATRAATRTAPAADRASRLAERMLRTAGDARIGLLLIAAVGAANLLAALLPGVRPLLDGPGYAVLLGLLALSGIAAVAVRAPVAWREWRLPGATHEGLDALVARLPVMGREDVAAILDAAGYRTRLEERRGRWAVHGVRRGASRFAGIVSHLALVAVVLGAAIGAAFGSQTVFSLLGGGQSLLDSPRPGFNDAVRLDRFDPAFGPDGRPLRLDAEVTFLRDGTEVESRILRVNEPGAFDGYLVHPWTYGPAARLRVTTLGGSALLDSAVPLDADRDGVPVGAAELPSVGLTLGLALADAGANEVGVSVLDGSGLVDAARLRPGDAVRLGDLEIRFDGFDSWVTFMSRSDPGLGLLLLGGAGLCASLAVALWVPRRRVTVRPRGAGLALVLRGERLDRPLQELDRLVSLFGRPPR